MKSNKQKKKTEQEKCSVCDEEVVVTPPHNECKKCGWRKNEGGLEYPTKILFPNLVSYDRAKELHKEGKPLKPTIDEFLETFHFWGKMVLHHKSQVYGLLALEETENYDDNMVLLNLGDGKVVQAFETIADFKHNAHINGVSIENLWNEIKRVDYVAA